MKVHTEKLTFDGPIKLESGSILSRFELMVETYVSLIKTKIMQYWSVMLFLEITMPQALKQRKINQAGGIKS